jgi:hypothetical protein
MKFMAASKSPHFSRKKRARNGAPEIRRSPSFFERRRTSVRRMAGKSARATL